jgi:tetratricopeptide (TPR) repeat protein
MFRHGLVAFVLSSLLFGAGCANKDLNASIERMNEGIDRYSHGEFSSAEKLFGEATSLYADNHMAWYNLGQTREKLDKYKEAGEAYSQAVKHNPKDAMYQYRLGKAEWENKNVSIAQSHLEESVKLNDRLYKAWYYLGLAYEASDAPKKAAEAFTRSATLNPYFGRSFISLGKLYIRWDKLPEAVSVLDQGRLNVKDPQELSDVYYHLGLAYERQGNWDKAIEAYSGALEKRSDNLDAKRQRGFSYASRGDKANAQKDLKEFVEAGGGGNAFNIQAANERLFRLMAE